MRELRELLLVSSDLKQGACPFLAAVVERRDFRDERGAQLACPFIVAPFEIGKAGRETIPSGLDRLDRIFVVDFPGGVERRRPEYIWFGNLACRSA
jgi:hypothetical protein